MGLEGTDNCDLGSYILSRDFLPDLGEDARNAVPAAWQESRSNFLPRIASYRPTEVETWASLSDSSSVCIFARYQVTPTFSLQSI